MIEEKKTRNKVKDWAFKIAKATIKATLIYVIYLVLSPYLGFLATIVPGLIETFEVFVSVTIVLTILGDLTAGSIFECVFNAGRALFTIAYIVFALGDGVLSVPLENIVVTVNLTVFYAIVALLSLVSLAKSALQAINFMCERAETGIKP
jgi:hypothetical protein